MIIDGKELYALLNAMARAIGIPDLETILEAREYLHKTFPNPRHRAACIMASFRECTEELGMTDEESVAWFKDGCINGGNILC